MYKALDLTSIMQIQLLIEKPSYQIVLHCITPKNLHFTISVHMSNNQHSDHMGTTISNPQKFLKSSTSDIWTCSPIG